MGLAEKEITVIMQERRDYLTSKMVDSYEKWIKENGLPFLSADEVICETTQDDEYVTTVEQRDMLNRFIRIWEATEEKYVYRDKVETVRDEGSRFFGWSWQDLADELYSFLVDNDIDAQDSYMALEDGGLSFEQVLFLVELSLAFEGVD